MDLRFVKMAGMGIFGASVESIKMPVCVDRRDIESAKTRCVSVVVLRTTTLSTDNPHDVVLWRIRKVA